MQGLVLLLDSYRYIAHGIGLDKGCTRMTCLIPAKTFHASCQKTEKEKASMAIRSANPYL